MCGKIYMAGCAEVFAEANKCDYIFQNPNPFNTAFCKNVTVLELKNGKSGNNLFYGLTSRNNYKMHLYPFLRLSEIREKHIFRITERKSTYQSLAPSIIN